MQDKRKKTAERKPENDLLENVINIGRVTKVTKGGRDFRFSACMVVGDGKGSVGIGTGKSKEVPEAIRKAKQNAIKNMVKVDICDGRTLFHEVNGISGSAKVMMKPASKGTGVIAGGAVRAVLDVVGIHDVLSKSLGSSTKINVARATIEGLKAQKSVEKIAELRGKTVEELLG